MEQEVFKKIRKLQIRADILFIIFVLSFIAVPVLFFTVDEYGFIAVGSLVASIFFFIKSLKKYTLTYKKEVVNVIIKECDFIDDLTYNYDLGLNGEVVNEANAVLFGERFTSNDFITGEYEKIKFAQSDISIESNGRNNTTYFRGRWLIVDFEKEFNVNMIIYSKNFWSAIKRNDLTRIRQNFVLNTEFNGKTFTDDFYIYADNEIEGTKILNSVFQKSVFDLKAKLHAPIIMVFKGNRLHVGVMNNKDAFEPALFTKIGYEKEKERMNKDLKVITDIIDVINKSVT